MPSSPLQRDSDAAQGALNLLSSCAGVKAGETVLIITEPAGSGHYDDRLTAILAQAARTLDAVPEVLVAPVPAGPEALPATLARAIETADHTIFLNRIGDQLRFAVLPGAGSKSIPYTLDVDFLASSFGRTPYALFQEVHDLVTQRLLDARRYRITCPLGTDVAMDLPPPRAGARAARVADFGVRNFPVMIIPAVSAAGLDGRLVFSQAFTSTYIHVYDDAVVPLAEPVAVRVERGRITGFEGDEERAAGFVRHFERVGRLFGGDPFAVNSWHAGINATTHFRAPALSDIDRWSSIAFGSPRYTHFHLCGGAPGDICGQLFDTTIRFDDEVIWDGGSLVWLGAAERDRLAGKYGVGREILDARLDIGTAPAAAPGPARIVGGNRLATSR